MSPQDIRWESCLCVCMRRVAGQTRVTRVWRQVSLLHFDPGRDLLMVRPGTIDGRAQAGPSHTQAMILILLARPMDQIRDFQHGYNARTNGTATELGNGLERGRSTTAELVIHCEQSAAGLELVIRPLESTPERTAGLFRMWIMLEPAQAVSEAA